MPKVSQHMRSMSAVIALGLVIVLLGAASLRSAAPAIVTVSLSRIASQSNAGKRANQQLETMRQERGRDLLAKQRALDEATRQLGKSGTPQADLDRLTQDQTRLRTELQQQTAQANSDFQTTQTRLNNEIRGQLAPILAEIAKRAGVDAVFNGDVMAWAAPGSDVTDEVIQRLNAVTQ